MKINMDEPYHAYMHMMLSTYLYRILSVDECCGWKMSNDHNDWKSDWILSDINVIWFLPL